MKATSFPRYQFNWIKIYNLIINELMKFKWPHRQSYIICQHTAAAHYYLTTAQTITQPNALYLPRLSKLFVSITVSVSIRAHIINYLFYGTFNILRLNCWPAFRHDSNGRFSFNGSSVLASARFRLHNNGIRTASHYSFGWWRIVGGIGSESHTWLACETREREKDTR